ncbi:glycosyltransferase family 4 protein [Ruminococcus flavefaciens]|nr:glycosyltransferase family 4 protein [Ruminococcus flavefaciens]
MEKIFFYGRYKRNTGPQNVNRALIDLKDSELLYVRFSNKYIRGVETFLKSKLCKCVLISGICTKRSLDLICKNNKNVCYLMHGCLEYENDINNEGLSEELIGLEKEILEKSSKIICVSQYYAQWVADRYPIYKDKIYYANNGLVLEDRKIQRKEEYSVAVSGGNRPIKNNDKVYKAIKKLGQEGIKCKLYVFGEVSENGSSLGKDIDIEICGQLDKDAYYKMLDRISVFVIDSAVEPFGLVLGDALSCHCSVLVTNNVGAKVTVEPLDKNSVIEDPDDIEEIAEKIKYLIDNSNYEMLINNFKEHKTTSMDMLDKIKSICLQK